MPIPRSPHPRRRPWLGPPWPLPKGKVCPSCGPSRLRSRVSTATWNPRQRTSVTRPARMQGSPRPPKQGRARSSRGTNRGYRRRSRTSRPQAKAPSRRRARPVGADGPGQSRWRTRSVTKTRTAGAVRRRTRPRNPRRCRACGRRAKRDPEQRPKKDRPREQRKPRRAAGVQRWGRRVRQDHPDHRRGALHRLGRQGEGDSLDLRELDAPGRFRPTKHPRPSPTTARTTR